MPRVVATDLMPEFSGRELKEGLFLLEEKLGSGAYGKVYRALDRRGRKDIPQYRAIKILHRHPERSDKHKIQEREFTIHHRASDHDNVVTFHGWFLDALYVYAVLDLCAGGDLFGAITEKHWYQDQPQRIKSTFLQVLDAVQHCHELNIFHRDIKPENILCSGDGHNVQLSDFGLSTTSEFSREFGCGSSYYMSPECIGGKDSRGLGDQYSTRCNDIWALGVILTNMTTGRNPWRYATIEDDCFRAFQNDNNFLKTVLPISGQMNTILKRIFVLDWEIRTSIPDLRRAFIELEAVYEGEQVIAQPQPRSTIVATFEEASPERPISKSPGKPEIVSVISPSPTLDASGALSGSTWTSPSGVSDPSLAPPSDSSGSSGSDTDKGPKTPASSALKAADIGIGINEEVPEYRLDNPANLQEVHEVDVSLQPTKKPWRTVFQVLKPQAKGVEQK